MEVGYVTGATAAQAVAFVERIAKASRMRMLPRRVGKGSAMGFGADVKDLPANMWHAVPGLGVELDKPVIAATSGWVVGGGFVLVQMADMCVASETTRFLYPEAKITILYIDIRTLGRLEDFYTKVAADENLDLDEHPGPQHGRGAGDVDLRRGAEAGGLEEG